MPGYLLAAAFHKQAFASATQHQLLAFLQVAAFTNRTAVLPFARLSSKPPGMARPSPKSSEAARRRRRIVLPFSRGGGSRLRQLFTPVEAAPSSDPSASRCSRMG